MGQEYFINSQEIENTIRKLLPSQGGAGAGFDLSASTQIIPVIDITATAEGSILREDLQTSSSFTSITSINQSGSGSTTLISNTGYWLIQYNVIIAANGVQANFFLTDGVSNKDVQRFGAGAISGAFPLTYQSTMNVFIEAGESLKLNTDANTRVMGSFRQIASIDGQLVNP
jgi:hypothetical protein